MRYQDIDFTDCDVMLNEPFPDDCNDDMGFIYYCKEYKQVIDLAVSNEVNLVKATRMWCKLMWTKAIEEILVENGATFIHERTNYADGVKINGIPYEIEILDINLDTSASTRAEKNRILELSLIPENNTLYFFIDKERYTKANWLKPNESNLRNAIESFMSYYNNHDLNSVTYNYKKIFSDIIVIK